MHREQRGSTSQEILGLDLIPRLNPVADYHGTEAAIRTAMPLLGVATVRCIQQFGVSPARRLHINNVLGRIKAKKTLANYR